MGQSVSLWEWLLQVRLNIHPETNLPFMEVLLLISISLGVPTEYECWSTHQLCVSAQSGGNLKTTD